ncbi:MAG TPA: hypothetical protein VEQ37_14650 [Actinomycetota bacterium]|nr:hypothetical protein [Actinomycetota bacterium]
MLTFGNAITVPSVRILIAEAGAEMDIGAGCVIMKQAVLRASGRFPLRLGEGVLVGPHAYATGCDVGARSFSPPGRWSSTAHAWERPASWRSATKRCPGTPARRLLTRTT